MPLSPSMSAPYQVGFVHPIEKMYGVFCLGYYGIRNISDRLCRENQRPSLSQQGLVRERAMQVPSGKTGTSWKGKLLKITVDALIPQASDFADFLRLCCKRQAIEIKPGKYISCRAPGREQFTRLKTLGADYTRKP